MTTQVSSANSLQMAAVHQAMAVHRRYAKVDAAAFCSYVLRDEQTNAPVGWHPHQVEWQALCDAHDRLVLWGYPGGGKSAQITIGRTLYDLGQNPNLRCVIVSNKHENAAKFVRIIKNYIEGKVGPELHQVFPDLRPASKYEGWSDSELFVQRTAGSAKDPSVRALGMSPNITGIRIDRLIIDDLLTSENTYTAHQRENVLRWLQSSLLDRLSGDARVCFLGNAWHPEDVMHVLAAQPGWVGRKYPIVHPDGRLDWPERFPLDRIRKIETTDAGPFEFPRKYLCQPRSGEAARFKDEWIKQCLLRGCDDDDPHSWKLASRLVGDVVPPGCRTFTGVDLSTGARRGDLTAIFTILVYPNGDRQVLDIQAGRWFGPEIMQRIERVHAVFKSVVIVEGSGQQELLNQILRAQTSVPVKSYFTTAKTFSDPHHGVETMAVEMANGKWIIPSAAKGQKLHPMVSRWVQELRQYDPGSHPGDILMASHFAVEGARETPPRPPTVRQLDTLRR